jgi:hypothetical protein
VPCAPGVGPTTHPHNVIVVTGNDPAKRLNTPRLPRALLCCPAARTRNKCCCAASTPQQQTTFWPSHKPTEGLNIGPLAVAQPTFTNTSPTSCGGVQLSIQQLHPCALPTHPPAAAAWPQTRLAAAAGHKSTLQLLLGHKSTLQLLLATNQPCSCCLATNQPCSCCLATNPPCSCCRPKPTLQLLLHGPKTPGHDAARTQNPRSRCCLYPQLQPTQCGLPTMSR